MSSGEDAKRIAIAPNGQRVVFLIVDEVIGSYELYSYYIDGSRENPYKLNGELPDGATVYNNGTHPFDITPVVCRSN